MEHSPQKIRHKRFATKKICHTTNVTENLSVSGSQLSPIPDPNSPNLNPPQPNPPTQPHRLQPPNPNPIPPPTPTYHRCVANLPHRHRCKRLSDAYAQILGHIRMSHPLCGESSVANLRCDESSGNRLVHPFTQFFIKMVSVTVRVLHVNPTTTPSDPKYRNTGALYR